MANGQNDPEARSKPDLNRFEHIQLGVWDLYIMRTRRMLWFPTSQKVEESTQIWKDIPYLRRTARYEHRSMAPYVVLPRHYSSQISDPSVEFVVSNAPLFSFS